MVAAAAAITAIATAASAVSSIQAQQAAETTYQKGLEEEKAAMAREKKEVGIAEEKALTARKKKIDKQRRQLRGKGDTPYQIGTTGDIGVPAGESSITGGVLG